MKRRWKILIALGGVCLLLAAALVVTLHTQPANELEAYKQQLRARGEQLELSEVIPPPGPPESNSVDAVQTAFRMYSSDSDNLPYAMQMVAPGKALVGWQQPNAQNLEVTNSWEQLMATVELDRPALEMLRQVLDRPQLDFHIDYSRGAQSLLPHLAPLKRSVQKLTTAAVFELHEGDTGSAATNILIMLALARNNVRDGLLISHLVRIAMTSIAVNAAWELLQTTNVTEAQLAAVQAGWQRMDFLSDAENSFMTERAWTSAIIREMRNSHGAIRDYMGGFGSSTPFTVWPPDWDSLTEKPRYAIGEVMWRSSWSYTDELRMLMADQIMLETIRTMRTNQAQCYKTNLDVMNARLAAVGVTNASRAFFSKLNIPDLGDILADEVLQGALHKALRADVACRIVSTAVALKRYQLQHGQWPETLGQLAPEFLAAVPIDPYDGKPLKYRSNADGTYLLYSVAEDGIDDGGIPADVSGGSRPSLYWLNPKAQDWVWPQPATPAEVRYFYEHPPK